MNSTDETIQTVQLSYKSDEPFPRLTVHNSKKILTRKGYEKRNEIVLTCKSKGHGSFF